MDDRVFAEMNQENKPMSQPSDWWREIDPAETAFFLDVDGTLLGFKDRPEDVIADDALLDTLRCLQSASGGAVALVSGRMISDLDRIVAPLVLPAGGVHGADLRFADGTRATMEGAALAAVRDKVTSFVAARPGLRLEDKGGAAFAVHYRQDPSRAEEVRYFLDDAVTGGDLMVQHGKMVAEVKPGQCHKGKAIAALMGSPPFAGRAPFFMGDDLTDEYGFETVNTLGGISVKVGDVAEDSVAGYRLQDTSAVRNFLRVICQKVEGKRKN